jgi:hypothetical protein
VATRRQITAGLRGTRIGGKPVSYADWKSGKLLSALLHPPAEEVGAAAAADGEL